ncbi:heavy metal translocating P-type ATPase, partial [Escherichia coli]|nr:heavy metal translocating P-type ATPase [Escherichia coli]
ISGQSLVDTSALTGESVPKEVFEGESVLSGFININQPLVVEVEKNYQNSTISKLLELVENASSKKAPAENFITKFARYYTPVVVVLAVLLAILPPLVLSNTGFDEWIYRALTFLVISCPCALVISVPLS